MNIESLTEEELKDIILKKQLEWIKLCQDNFLVFAESVCSPGISVTPTGISKPS